MTTIATINFDSNNTMSSVDLLDVINTFRLEGGKTEMRHDTFMAKIREEFGEDVAPEFSGTTIRDQGLGRTREYACFNLPKDECLIMAMTESKAVRRGVVNYLNSLEQEVEVLVQGLEDVLDSETLEAAKFCAEMTLVHRDQLRLGHTNDCRIIANSEDLGLKDAHKHSQIMNLACKAAIGVSATVFKREHGVAPRDAFAANNDLVSISAYDKALTQITTMIDCGMDYHTIAYKVGVKTSKNKDMFKQD